MSYGQRKKSTGTRGPSQGESGKDTIRTNDVTAENPEHGLNLSGKHLPLDVVGNTAFNVLRERQSA